jgi:kinesin family member 1
MLGYGVNKGVVPMVLHEIFQRIAATTSPSTQYQVSFSMLEIYNERVKDLLVTDNAPGGLIIRQHPKSGFFVDGLTQTAVSSYNEVERRMQQGVVNRTTASTLMNETSSRSHMVITIKFKQVRDADNDKNSTTITSDINLVDLAGSERADSSGATGIILMPYAIN